MTKSLILKTASVYLEQFNGSALNLINYYLERIAVRESDVGAWQFIDPALVRQQAAKRDTINYGAGQTQNPLHGIPIGIKDIFATADMPTGWGVPFHADRYLGYDAAVVERLRSAGAVIMGKTVSTEYAAARCGKTRNPHNLNHTPGGSSSGSAAAVADGMVPLAIGSQTVGSILRPAAYCGVLGFKPSFGLISRYGMMPVCRELDHVGIFGNSIADIALLFSVLAAPDDRDPDCYGHLAEATQRDPSHPINFALIRGPHWAKIEPSAEQTFLHSVESLRDAGAIVTEVALPEEFDAYFDHVDALLCAGLAANHGTDYDRFPEQLSAKIHQLIEKGRDLASLTYVQARQAAVAYNIVLSTILSRFDAIITPVTLGTAPEGLEDTGSPIFCALWSLCGLPAISIPAGKRNGLPVAVQLVGRRTRDRDLLGIAKWVNHTLSQQIDESE